MSIDTRQQVLLVDPITQPVVPPFSSAPRLANLTHKRVALIDDSKENAKELLDEIVALLGDRFGVAKRPQVAEMRIVQSVPEPILLTAVAWKIRPLTVRGRCARPPH